MNDLTNDQRARLNAMIDEHIEQDLNRRLEARIAEAKPSGPASGVRGPSGRVPRGYRGAGRGRGGCGLGDAMSEAPKTILVRVTKGGEASTVIAPNREWNHKASKRYPVIAEYALVRTMTSIQPCPKCARFE